MGSFLKIPRIPIWLPLVGLLFTFGTFAIELYNDVARDLIRDAIVRKTPDSLLMKKVFTSPVPSDVPEEYIRLRIIRDALRGSHRNTLVSVYDHHNDDRKLVADNRADIKDRIPEAAADYSIKLLQQWEMEGEEFRLVEGARFFVDGTEYHMIGRHFQIRRSDRSESGELIFITNLDTRIAPTRTILIRGVTKITGAVGFWGIVAISINVTPLIQITRQIRRGQPIRVSWWVPIQFELLAEQLRLNQDANNTYRRKADESAAIANATINGISDAVIFLKDADGVYLLCNEAFKPIAGRDPIGLKDSDFAWTPEQTAKYREEDAGVIATGEPISLQEQIGVGPDSHWYLTRKVRVSIEGKPAMLGISLDVDELIQARRAAESLAEEIQTVNHIAVHDIKADLTALNLGAELIQETIDELTVYLADKSDDVVDEAIDTINHFAGLNIKSARNAFDVLDQRNKLYNLESKMEIAACPVTDLLDSLSAAFSSEPGELRIHNECPENRQILADKSLLLTVLKNIVRNGFVHNDSALKRVEIRVGPIGHRSRIQITDNGVGMPSTYLENWGKVLGKAAQLSTKRGGSGTGLYSIRAIVLAHKGASINVTSAVGQGTTFTLEFDHVA